MSSLPPEIITNLLSGLPVKSLLRFRCVSKPWCAQIDGPDFIKLHLAHSIATGSSLSPIAESEGTLYSLDSDSLKKLARIKTPFTDYQTILFNSCNGLILLETKDPKGQVHGLILFNPSTRKHYALPRPPAHNSYGGVDAVFGSSCFGYDAMNDDYKVFTIFDFVDRAKRLVAREAKVYSLKSNSWRIIRDFAKGITYDRLFEACVNGSLHTVNCEKPRSIVAFDVGKEDFHLIPMPKFGDKNMFLFTAHVFDGCLALLCRYPDERTDIWVMKEYGVKESWSMLLSVKPKKSRLYVMPMLYSKSRAEVLLSYDCKQLVWYNLRKKTVRNFEVRGLPIGFGPVVCVGRLVSAGGSGKVDEKKQQQGEDKMKEEKGKKRDEFLSKGFKLKL